ncbi:MAG TPA: MFS transporter [Bacillales bacterium]|nr:MFS transporter [Bacillales bacterium]
MLKKRSVGFLRGYQYFFHSTNAIMIGFLPIYFKSQGLSGAEIGALLAVGPFASLFSQPFWGYMSDKYKTVKKMLMICLVGFLLAGLLFFSMDAFMLMIMTGFVLFFFMSPLGALGDSLSQRTAAEKNISFGGIRAWGSIGFATTSLLTGAIFSVIGVERILLPFLFFGFLALLSGFSVSDVKVSNKKLRLKDVRKLTNDLPFLLFLFLILFITVTHRTNDSFIGIYVKSLGGTDSLVGWAWFIGVASEAAVFALGYAWFRRFHELTFITFAGFLYTLRWVLYAFVTDPHWLVFFQVLHGITFGIFYLASVQYVTKVVPKELQATGLLLFISVFFGLSGIIGGLLGGFLMDQAGGHVLYGVMSVTAFAGSLGITAYGVVRKKKRERAAAAVGQKSLSAGGQR